MTHEIDKLRDCPVLAMIEAMGGKWRTRILWCLRDGPCRFGDLERRIGLSVKVLTQNLRALEAEGLVSRFESRTQNAVMTEYSYTDYGRSLIPILDAMGSWGIGHMARADANSSRADGRNRQV